MPFDYLIEHGPVRSADELDWDAVSAYVRSRLDWLGPLTSVRQFYNGSANLTYLLDFDCQRLVVRRPPFGHIAAGSHDMAREFRALSRLWQHYDRAPRAYLLCDDTTLVGASFLVVEYRQGQVVWGRVPPTMTHHQDVARRLAFAVVDALAELHLLDPNAAGMSDLGRPVGFLNRQLAGWRKRWQATSQSAEVAEVERVAEALAAGVPDSQRVALLHNDFKIDNCQFDPGDPDRVKSVFDWDMATIGDPLVDLGIMLNYWPDPSESGDDPPIHPAGQETMGLPARAEIVEHYASVTHFDVEALRWYEAFGCWKTAIAVAHLYDRYLRGDSHDERQASKGQYVASLARRAGTILAG